MLSPQKIIVSLITLVILCTVSSADEFHGTVIENADNGGSIDLRSSNDKTITATPTNEQLTSALSSSEDNIVTLYKSKYAYLLAWIHLLKALMTLQYMHLHIV